MMSRYCSIGVYVALAIGCGSHDTTKFDFLMEDISTRELYAQHRGDPPEVVATLRAALRTDSRPVVRQNAIVALSASSEVSRLDDFIFALDDRDRSVVSEAGFSIAAVLTDTTFPDEARARAIDALRKHAGALRAAFDLPGERVRFNVMLALEAISDRELDLAKPLGDEGSLIRGEGLKLAAARAYSHQGLSFQDAETLVEFVHHERDPQFHADAIALLVQFAPDRVEPLLIRGIADGSVNLKHVVALHLTSAVPAIISYIKRGRWTTGHLDTLVAFHAVCAAPAIAALYTGQSDKGPQALIRDALRALSERDDATDAQLIAWAKHQSPDAPPCR